MLKASMPDTSINAWIHRQVHSTKGHRKISKSIKDKYHFHSKAQETQNDHSSS